MRVVIAVFLVGVAWTSQAATLTPRAQACAEGAADYHKVNPQTLTAILLHESRGKADVVLQNTNGSLDVGLAGTNSVHFQELAKKGVAPRDLLDECVSAYVGAWNYSKKVFKHGNTWQAVGAYHSETPIHNALYQIAIYNKMVDLGFLVGAKLAKPAR